MFLVFLGGSVVKNLPVRQETPVQSLGQEDPLEKEIETHSSILAWEILWTEEPGGLQSMGHKELDTTERQSMHASRKPDRTYSSSVQCEIHFQLELQIGSDISLRDSLKHPIYCHATQSTFISQRK